LKNPRKRRRLKLPEEVVAALRAHRVRQLQERLAAGVAWHELDLVFARQDGGPIDPTVVRANLARALKRAGLPRVRFHDLRHSAASNLLANGEHPRVVQDLLGHSSATITMDVYSHVTPALSAGAATRMDVMLRHARAKRTDADRTGSG
jgi:integrase